MTQVSFILGENVGNGFLVKLLESKITIRFSANFLNSLLQNRENKCIIGKVRSRHSSAW